MLPFNYLFIYNEGKAKVSKLVARLFIIVNQ
jgi:hypothetical protein